MGYVADGRFRKKLELFFGPLVAHDDVEDRPDWVDQQLTVVAKELAIQVDALYELHRQFEVPELCEWGVFQGCTWPALFSLDEEALRAEQFFDVTADEERALVNIVLYSNGWGTYVTVGAEGVMHLCEDPHSFAPLCDDLETFLDAVLHLEAAKRGKFPAKEAIAGIVRALRPLQTSGPYPLFIQRSLERVRELDREA